MTASFGITALNELQELYNGKSIREDGQFALEVLKYINDKVNQFKQEDGYLYAIYGTPAESLCGLQVEQFRKTVSYTHLKSIIKLIFLIFPLHQITNNIHSKMVRIHCF